MRRKRGVVTQSVICSISPLGYFEDGSPFYPIMGAEGGSDEDENGGDEEDEQDEDDKDSEGEKPKEEKLPKPKRRAPANETAEQKVRRLNAENKERRETAERLEQELRERDDKDKSELEVAKRDGKEFKTRAEKAEERLIAAQVENAFLKFRDGKEEYKWQDPELVLDILNSKYELVLGDDGTVEGLAAAIRDLAKSKPFLLVDKNESDGNGDGSDTKARKQGASGGASGARKSDGKGQAQRQKLMTTYTALGQGVQI